MERQLKKMFTAIAVVLTLTYAESCKSLEKRCVARFPSSTHIKTMIISKDTLIGGSITQATVPCPEYAKSLPDDGKKVILKETDDQIITGSKGSNGQLLLEAMTKPKLVPRSNVSNTTERESNICNCDSEVKAAKFDTIIECIWAFCVLVLIVALFYYFKYARNENSQSKV